MKTDPREWLDYNPVTGVFIWRKGNLYGREAGSISSAGYRIIRLQGCTYQAHRLAWLFIYGEEPDVIDHIDHNRLNNAIANLRNITKSENALNKSGRTSSRTGHQGIQFQRGKYVAVIKHKGKRVVQKSFDDIDEAIAFREAKLHELGFHPNHGY